MDCRYFLMWEIIHLCTFGVFFWKAKLQIPRHDDPHPQPCHSWCAYISRFLLFFGVAKRRSTLFVTSFLPYTFGDERRGYLLFYHAKSIVPLWLYSDGSKLGGIWANVNWSVQIDFFIWEKIAIDFFAIFCDFFLGNQIRHWEKTEEDCKDLLTSVVSLLGTVESSK